MEERKHLKSCTIVPDDYYVERSADIQIQSIIEDMERPGYVLVARQMGKTNLLLHTKRVMQDERNIFVYIDFTSSSLDSERECLEYIIDTALEMNESLFEEERTEIFDKRRDYYSNPTKQFTSEIKILLRKVDKLVLVFDEIDALTRCSFSDHIFSLIRSHYFQRANFPILKKLTYVLSGVIEPKDIIKDPNISPFNIGEKIYLKDFTREEFDDFSKRIEFNHKFDKSVLDRIYYWTCGHPRMTWDLCLEVEKANVAITSKDIDEIVKNLYLISFDHAPIDSIRRMVEKNPTLINAVLELSIKKGKSISKEIRNQLYLAGVIDYSDTDVYFKNPIMEKALPYNWLISLQSSENAYLQKALEYIYLEKNYKEAVVTLKALADTVLGELKSRVYLNLGIAYYRLFQNSESKKWLENIKSDEANYHEALYWIACNCVSLDKTDEAIDTFDRVIHDSDDDRLVTLACIGKSDVLITSDDDVKINDARNILIGLLRKMENNGVDLHNISVINYELSTIESHFKDYQRALSFIDQAINFSQPNERPMLLYNKVLIMQNEEEKEKVVVSMIDSLSVVNRKPDLEDFESMLGINQFYLSLIFSLIILDYPQYIASIQDKFKLLYERIEDAYISISRQLEYGKKKTESYKLASLMEKQFQDGVMRFSGEQIMWVYSVLLAYCDNKDDANKISDRVFKLLSENTYNEEMPLNIGLALINIVNRATVVRDNEKCVKAIQLYRLYFGKNTNNQVQQNLLVFYFRLANIAYLKSDVDEFYSNALEYIRTLNMIDVSEYLKGNYSVSLVTLKEKIKVLCVWGYELSGNKMIDNYLELKYGKLDKNTKVEVFDKINGVLVIDKYKHLKDYILAGFAEIHRVL